MSSKKTRRKRKPAAFFTREDSGLYVIAAIFGCAGVLLLAGAIHMSLSEDKTAYYTRETIKGPVRSEYNAVFLYLIGGAMLEMSGLILRPKERK
jgi:hypothetical protein